MLPRMRFLCYEEKGGDMQPHVDLSKRDVEGSTASTHTFILHLRDCEEGGETVLLQTLKRPKSESIGSPRGGGSSSLSGSGGGGTEPFEEAEDPAVGEGGEGGSWIMASVSPRRGRLLVFPHNCPHAGLPVTCVPKLFLRGELILHGDCDLHTVATRPVAMRDRRRQKCD